MRNLWYWLTGAAWLSAIVLGVLAMQWLNSGTDLPFWIWFLWH